jgi:hypothetical protein
MEKYWLFQYRTIIDMSECTAITLLISGDITSFHRYPIRSFDYVEQDGRDKWTAYKFILNVYNTFVPIDLERIRTAIDQLPDPNPQSS